jgi:hypothetical protein
MYRVVPPRDWLRQRLWSIKDEVDSGRWFQGGRPPPKGGGPGRASKAEALAKVENGISKLWVRVPVSKVQAGWRYVHGLEDAHVPDLPREVVDEQLKTVAVRLQTIPGVESKDLRDRLDKPPKERKRRAALLREAQIFRHNYQDTRYENLASLLGKAVWLTWVALAFVVALAALFDLEPYFLLGAAGGLISRLTRVLRRRPRASDYGAEWSTLIISPAAGAVLGWLGVLITVALANDPFNVLSDDFAKLWDDASAPLGLAIAFLFGFSERFFDRLVARWEAQVTGKFPDEESDDERKSNPAAQP